MSSTPYYSGPIYGERQGQYEGTRRSEVLFQNAKKLDTEQFADLTVSRLFVGEFTTRVESVFTSVERKSSIVPRMPSQCFSFRAVTLNVEPFPHFAVPNFVDRDLGDSLLEWFETDAQWGTYNGDGFCVRESNLQLQLKELVSGSFSEYLSSEVARVFGAKLSNRVDVTAHRLSAPRHIGIHTDYGRTKQTHRLVVQINRGWKAEWGGLLLFLSSRAPGESTDQDRVFVPHHCCAMCFELSPRSFHAVSPISCGVRYTLCFAFYGQV